jgi:hypothetical protein
LNALANHGYLPHNGIGTIDQFIDSVTKGECDLPMRYTTATTSDSLI